MQVTFDTLPSAVAGLYDKFADLERMLRVNEMYVPMKSDAVWTIQEAAKFLSLSVPTLYGLVSRKRIPVMKKGKRLYFLEGELREWLKAGRKESAQEVDDEISSFLGGLSKGGRK